MCSRNPFCPIGLFPYPKYSSLMKIDIRHNPSFAVARLTLDAGEQVRAESGSMMMHQNITIDAKAEGGMLKSLKRATLGGESFFITTFTAGNGGGWVDVAPNLPGDVVVIDVPSSGLIIQRGSWLANTTDVTIETQWGGMKNLVGGEGGFAITATGNGPVVIGCYGALDVINLQPNEKLVVDSGHMVAYEANVNCQLTRATAGIANMVKSAEGFVLEFTGPGRVWTQSRSPRGLISWLAPQLGSTQQGSGPGGAIASLGGLLGRD
jgi:uncharacterized protein (TIGR00266 family)